MASSVTSNDIRNPSQPLTCLTCYDYLTARIMDQVHDLDMILVGDSLGMVALGYDSTLPVTLDDMVHHVSAVSRGVERAYVAADMPFLRMAESRDRVVHAVRRLFQEADTDAVKMEGGETIASDVNHLVEHDIPVIGHLGLTPQSVKSFGGYRVQARGRQDIRKLGRDARALEDAGIMALVLECIPAPVARELTDMLGVPTIGIGAGSGCSGQVLVWSDMMGLSEESTMRFVRQWEQMGKRMRDAIQEYCRAVRDRDFPDPSESYSLPEEVNDSDVRSWLTP